MPESPGGSSSASSHSSALEAAVMEMREEKSASSLPQLDDPDGRDDDVFVDAGDENETQQPAPAAPVPAGPPHQQRLQMGAADKAVGAESDDGAQDEQEALEEVGAVVVDETGSVPPEPATARTEAAREDEDVAEQDATTAHEVKDRKGAQQEGEDGTAPATAVAAEVGTEDEEKEQIKAVPPPAATNSAGTADGDADEGEKPGDGEELRSRCQGEATTSASAAGIGVREEDGASAGEVKEMLMLPHQGSPSVKQNENATAPDEADAAHEYEQRPDSRHEEESQEADMEATGHVGVAPADTEPPRPSPEIREQEELERDRERVLETSTKERSNSKNLHEDDVEVDTDTRKELAAAATAACTAPPLLVASSAGHPDEGVVRRLTAENQSLREQLDLLVEENALLKRRVLELASANPTTETATQTGGDYEDILAQAKALLLDEDGESSEKGGEVPGPRGGEEAGPAGGSGKTKAIVSDGAAGSGTASAFAAFLPMSRTGSSSRPEAVDKSEDLAERRSAFVVASAARFAHKKQRRAAPGGRRSTSDEGVEAVDDEEPPDLDSLDPLSRDGIRVRNKLAEVCRAVIASPARNLERRMNSLQFLLYHWTLVSRTTGSAAYGAGGGSSFGAGNTSGSGSKTLRKEKYHHDKRPEVESSTLGRHVRLLMDAETWTPESELLELRLQILRLLVKPMERLLAARPLATALRPEVRRFRGEVRSLCSVALTDNIFVGEKRRACQLLLELGFDADEFDWSRHIEANARLFDLLTKLLIDSELGSPEASVVDVELASSASGSNKKMTLEMKAGVKLDLDHDLDHEGGLLLGATSASASLTPSDDHLSTTSSCKDHNYYTLQELAATGSSGRTSTAARGPPSHLSTKQLLFQTLETLLKNDLRLLYYVFYRYTEEREDMQGGANLKRLSVHASIKALAVRQLRSMLESGLLSPTAFVAAAGPQILAAFVKVQMQFGEAEALCVGILEKLLQNTQLALEVLFGDRARTRGTTTGSSGSRTLAGGAAGGGAVAPVVDPVIDGFFPAPEVSAQQTTSAPTDDVTPLYSSLHNWIFNTLQPRPRPDHPALAVTSNALLWAVGLHRSATFRLQLLQLPPECVIQRVLEFFELALECVEEVEKDDLPYGLAGFRVTLENDEEEQEAGDGRAEEDDAASSGSSGATSVVRHYNRQLDRALVVEPFLLALHERGLPTKWWPLLEKALLILRALLDHWDTTSKLGVSATTTSVPDLLIAQGFMDRLFELFDVPAPLLTDALAEVAQDCLKLLLKKNSEICLFSLEHFVETRKNTTFVELACCALEESDFFLNPDPVVPGTKKPPPSSTSSANVDNTLAQKFRLAILKNLVDIYKKLGFSSALQQRLRRCLAALFDQAGSVGLLLCVLQHYESELSGQMGAVVSTQHQLHQQQPHGRASSGGSSRPSATPVLPLAIEVEVLRAIARLPYWNPGAGEDALVTMLLAVLVDSIRESLQEDYVSEVLDAVLHLLVVDPSIDRKMVFSVVAACSNAFASNEMKRKSYENAEQLGAGMRMGMGAAAGGPSQPQGQGGLGLFDEEEEIERKQSEREQAVSFVMKIMQRFPTSDPIGIKSQHLLTAVLESQTM